MRRMHPHAKFKSWIKMGLGNHDRSRAGLHPMLETPHHCGVRWHVLRHAVCIPVPDSVCHMVEGTDTVKVTTIQNYKF